MNLLLHWLDRAYFWILNLYPRRFRDEFAAEMRAVFRNSLRDAAEEGVFQVALVCARELAL